MVAILIPNGKQSYTDGTGKPLVGGKLYTYAAGTNTPQATWVDSAQVTPNTNPIILNARGEAIVFWNGNYKIALNDADDNVVWPPIDNVSAVDVGTSITSLLATLLSSVGAAMVGFMALGVGAILRTIQAKLRERVSIADFGAVAGQDAGLAIQKAIDALPGSGGEIFVPATASPYLWNTAVDAGTKPIRMVGDAWYGSQFSVTANVTCFTSAAWHQFDCITWTGSGPGLSATAVKVKSSAEGHLHSGMTNCFVNQLGYAYWSLNTNAVQIMHNEFGCTLANLRLENLVNSDIGDSFIGFNKMSAGTGINILAPSTAGIYMVGNKFLNAGSHFLCAATGGNTGNFIFSANSFEGHTDYAIKCLGTNTITKVLISGNQFSSLAMNNHIVLSGDTRNVTIAGGNTFNSDSSGTVGTGISIETGAQDIAIDSNEFYDIKTAIAIASVNSRITLGDNNRYSPTVKELFEGPDAATSGGANVEGAICATQTVTNASDADYVDTLKFSGYGTAEIQVFGNVVGAGTGTFYQKINVAGTASTDITAATATGADFDVAIAVAGGRIVVQVKRAAGIGSSVTAGVTVRLAGYFQNVERT